jgi:hypothetical protein
LSAVLDVSGAALDRARARLESAARTPIWIEADVTGDWALKPMDIWHDRAVFHFLTTAADRAHYKQHLLDTLKPGGNAIIATFALDGPEQCSGLPVERYSPSDWPKSSDPPSSCAMRAHVHTTPRGHTQSFQYSRLRRLD